jgi:hypothetical protein
MILHLEAVSLDSCLLKVDGWQMCAFWSALPLAVAYLPDEHC